ncbi:hypothetical protein FF100_05035 [Methylobacterium terricola]|uniref:Helix-turn-helix n=1 Tax=Methylobacterium terricola TaxID=2583531 RepID=A0A5C4LNA8_9HYPH|nr:hypothetical protein [Methylobacterium terricola]TNC14941.1 hypothetical protein FF100_05035 [Methylobacterium terricola]
MDNEPWQRRAKAAGLSQKMLAEMTGRPVNTISRQIRGEHGAVPLHLIAVITAWELMGEEQRDEWRRLLAREAARQDAAG